MIDTSKAISETAYILECIATLKSIQESGSCEDCLAETCRWRPKEGMMPRYNCPFYERKEA